MTSSRARLRHSALVYHSPDEYVGRASAFLREGLEAGDGAVVANTRSGLAAMRDTLGSDGDCVTFVDVGATYTRPARTLAAYHAVFAEQLGQSNTVRAVADVQFGPDPREWDLWMGYEALFNRSFEHLPVWVWCTYDATGLPDPMVDGIRRTHPEVVSPEGPIPSGRYEDPDDFLRRIAREPILLPDLRSIPVGRDPEEFREHLAEALRDSGVPGERALDMLLAASDIYANAVQHGGGVEDVRVGRVAGRFVCEVVDRGSGFDDPSVGYLAPREGVGAGLWVARQLTWDLEFLDVPDGFTCRIWL